MKRKAPSKTRLKINRAKKKQQRPRIRKMTKTMMMRTKIRKMMKTKKQKTKRLTILWSSGLNR